MCFLIVNQPGRVLSLISHFAIISVNLNVFGSDCGAER